MGKHFGRNAIGSTQNIKAFGYQSSTDTSITPAREDIDDIYKNRGSAKLKIHSYLVTMVTHKLESKYRWYDKRECKG